MRQCVYMCILVPKYWLFMPIFRLHWNEYCLERSRKTLRPGVCRPLWMSSRMPGQSGTAFGSSEGRLRVEQSPRKESPVRRGYVRTVGSCRVTRRNHFSRGGWDFLSGACRGGIVKSPERAWVSFPQGGLCQAVRDIPLSRIFNAGGGPYSRRDDFLGDTPGR
jgi:hypothetical protein